jgi:hypothetical protein
MTTASSLPQQPAVTSKWPLLCLVEIRLQRLGALHDLARQTHRRPTCYYRSQTQRRVNNGKPATRVWNRDTVLLSAEDFNTVRCSLTALPETTTASHAPPPRYTIQHNTVPRITTRTAPHGTMHTSLSNADYSNHRIPALDTNVHALYSTTNECTALSPLTKGHAQGDAAIAPAGGRVPALVVHSGLQHCQQILLDHLW